MHGIPTLVPDLVAWARPLGITVIEDSAQAHGSSLEGRTCGSLGDVAAFSFYPGKNLGSLGDAGAVATDSEEDYGFIRAIRDYSTPASTTRHFGRNSRMDGLQARVLRYKLRFLDEWNEKRCLIARRYRDELDGLGLWMPREVQGMFPNYHHFTVRTSHRDELRAWLASRAIETRSHYPTAPMDQHPFTETIHSEGLLGRSIANTNLSLPSGPELTATQVQHVIDSVQEFFLAS